MDKSIFKSKTFWTQVLATASTLIPSVQEFLASNPVEAVAVLGALNVVVRFFTKGRVNVLG